MKRKFHGAEVVVFPVYGASSESLVSGCCSLSLYARTMFLLMFLFMTYAQPVAVVGGTFPREQRALACSAAGYQGARGMGR